MASRILAIGDIHGCLAQFEALLHALAPTSDDHIILLGDYVDRGPDSAGVLKRTISLTRTHHLTCVMGNHEQMMLEARSSHDKYSDWLLNGGDATLKSYAGVRATLRDIPGDHWTFLEGGLRDYVETDSHIFVHANAYPDMPMQDQPDYMLRWERFDEIAPHESGKVIVCGHTPQKSGRPANRGYAICIDTHAHAGRMLTCLDATSGRLWQADAGGRIHRSHISDYSTE